MTKEEIKERFKQEFFNGLYIELHSGDIDEIVDLVYEIINETKKAH